MKNRLFHVLAVLLAVAMAVTSLPLAGIVWPAARAAEAKTEELPLGEYIRIENKKDFLAMLAREDQGESYLLMEDIDFGGAALTPRKVFSGALVGQGHTLSNFIISAGENDRTGLFEYLTGIVDCVNISNARIDQSIHSGSIGIICGLASNACISNCSINGKIDLTLSKQSFVGSIVGNGGTIENCNVKEMEIVILGCSNIMIGGISGCNSEIIDTTFDGKINVSLSHDTDKENNSYKVYIAGNQCSESNDLRTYNCKVTGSISVSESILSEQRYLGFPKVTLYGLFYAYNSVNEATLNTSIGYYDATSSIYALYKCLGCTNNGECTGKDASYISVMSGCVLCTNNADCSIVKTGYSNDEIKCFLNSKDCKNTGNISINSTDNTSIITASGSSNCLNTGNISAISTEGNSTIHATSFDCGTMYAYSSKKSANVYGAINGTAIAEIGHLEYHVGQTLCTVFGSQCEVRTPKGSVSASNGERNTYNVYNQNYLLRRSEEQKDPEKKAVMLDLHQYCCNKAFFTYDELLDVDQKIADAGIILSGLYAHPLFYSDGGFYCFLELNSINQEENSHPSSSAIASTIDVGYIILNGSKSLKTPLSILNNAYGNIFFCKIDGSSAIPLINNKNKNGYIDITKPETTNYDTLYADVILTADGQAENVTIDLTLPQGWQFADGKNTKTVTTDIDYCKHLPPLEIHTNGITPIGDISVTGDISGSVSFANVRSLPGATLAGVNNEDGTKGKENKTPYSFDPQMFFTDNKTYSQPLALFSAYMSAMMENNNKNQLKEQIKNNLLQLGFSKIQYSGSTSKAIMTGTQEEYVFAQKTVLREGKPVPVVLVAVQGSDTGVHALADWLQNANYRDPTTHDNFQLLANNLMTEFLAYCKANGITDFANTRFVVTGHSRGGANANRFAHLLQNKTGKDNLYCYTFAAPNTTNDKNRAKDAFIFNIINRQDVVPFVPGRYSKYGVNLMFDSDKLGKGKTSENIMRGAALLHLCSRDTIEDVVDKQRLWLLLDVVKLLDLDQHDMARYISAVKGNTYQTDMDFDRYCAGLDNAAQVDPLFVKNENDREKLREISAGITRFLKSREGIVALLTGAAIVGGFLVKNSFFCPVDIDVLAEDGTVVCRIQNDELAFCDASNIDVTIIGDEKQIVYPQEAGYTLQVRGYETGTMDYSVSYYDENGIAAVYRFNDIPVSSEQTVAAAPDALRDTNAITVAGEEKAPDAVLTGEEIPTAAVTLQADDDAMLLGGGTYAEDEFATVAAIPGEDGAVFLGWYNDRDELVSEEEVFSFRVTEETALHAVWGEPPEEPAAYILGDVDNDGNISSADARLALRASVKLEYYEDGSSQFLAADVNKDGRIGADDARIILRVSVGLEILDGGNA